jgi:hypothetical protein
VSLAVAFAVLFTPELCAAGRSPGLDAFGTRRLDGDRRDELTRANDQDGTWRKPHCCFGHGTQRGTGETAPTVSANNDEISFQISG